MSKEIMRFNADNESQAKAFLKLAANIFDLTFPKTNDRMASNDNFNACITDDNKLVTVESLCPPVTDEQIEGFIRKK